MINIEENFLKSVFAPKDSLFALLSCSGTGAMDAVVQNTLTKKDKVLVINGGSFGNRFKEICDFYDPIDKDTTIYALWYPIEDFIEHIDLTIEAPVAGTEVTMSDKYGFTQKPKRNFYRS